MATESRKQKVFDALKSNKLVKIISGIKNYDKQKTLGVAIAAELGGANALDVCDDPEIIKVVRASVELPLFVSSVDPLKLIAAVSHGADVLEIGNYEPFYKEDKMFTPSEIIEIFQFVKKSVPKETTICVTVPATLELENQFKLGQALINLGADMLQTEGFAQDVPDTERKDSTYVDILKAASTLTNTVELRKNLPGANVICASGITPTTAPLAIAMGANGIGIGSYVNRLPAQIDMTENVKKIMASISHIQPPLMISKLGKKIAVM